MNGAFYIGATGLEAEQRALDVVANNITNVNTPGYKRAQARFSELVGGATSSDPAASGADSASADTPPALSGVAVDTNGRVFTQGDLTQTGKPLDVAIQGDGFIELAGPGGQTMLSRGGSLEVNSDGYLAGSDGLPLKAMIAVPTGAAGVTIGADGTVSATSGQGASLTLGHIELVRPRDMTTLTAAQDGLYTTSAEGDLTASTPGQDGAGTLVAGSLENSNVTLSDEMVNLLLLQRAYAANAQVLQAGDQLMAIANGLRR